MLHLIHFFVKPIVLVIKKISIEVICIFSYDNDKPKDASNDRFILSKGHCAPILYAAHAMSGLFPIEEIQKLRKLDSDLEGTFRLNTRLVFSGKLPQYLHMTGIGLALDFYIFSI